MLVIAGTGDRLVPVGMSQQLYEAAPGPKQLVLVPGADHGDERLLAGTEVLDALRGFLASVSGMRQGVHPLASPPRVILLLIAA